MQVEITNHKIEKFLTIGVLIMSSFTLLQSAFAISLASNAVSDYEADNQSVLQEFLSQYLSGGDINGVRFAGFFRLYNTPIEGGDWPTLVGNDWAVAWGPCVTAQANAGSTQVYASNAMYVAHSPSQNAYVVAIAGTDFDDVYDWLQEDSAVDPSSMVAWSNSGMDSVSTQTACPTSPPGACISAGTAAGLCALLNMQDRQGQTLQSFLEGVAQPQNTLIFTGHSLGGALSPALALYLYPDPPSGSTPPQSGWGKIYVLPTAGPTGGNSGFATTFNTAYPAVTIDANSSPKQIWNSNYKNEKDVVPNAWNNLTSGFYADSKGDRFWNYGQLTDDMYDEVFSAMDVVNAYVISGDYTPINTTSFKPTWGFYVWLKTNYFQWPPVWFSLPTEEITTYGLLGALMDIVHLDQYPYYFGVTPIPKLPVSASEAEVKTRPGRETLSVCLQKRTRASQGRVTGRLVK